MLGNSYHSPWDAAVPKHCGWTLIWKPVCFHICVFLSSSTITALCVSLETAASTVTGAREGQHPASLHPFLTWSRRERLCPHFHPPTSSTEKLCTVCAAQECVLQALIVESRKGWIWANILWMSSNALCTTRFFYSGMMAFLITVLASSRTGAIIKAGPQRKAVSIPWVSWSEVNLFWKWNTQR